MGRYGFQDWRQPRDFVPHQFGLDYADAVRTAGGKVDVVNLPEIGIKGNSHMLMMDKNNTQTADLINKWLTDKGLTD
jgi:hypothetical protein